MGQHRVAYHHLGEHTQAIASYHNALRLFRQAGERYYEADALTHLGDTHRALGEMASAQEPWRRAARILDDLGHPDAEATRQRLTAAQSST